MGKTQFSLSFFFFFLSFLISISMSFSYSFSSTLPCFFSCPLSRLAKATLELAGACMRADGSVRKRTELENAVSSNEESIDNLDKQLAESKVTLVDSESKFEDISRKLTTLEADSTKGNDRAEGAEKKIRDIEEELRVVGANLQNLEVGEEKTIQREENSQAWLS